MLEFELLRESQKKTQKKKKTINQTSRDAYACPHSDSLSYVSNRDRCASSFHASLFFLVLVSKVITCSDTIRCKIQPTFIDSSKMILAQSPSTFSLQTFSQAGSLKHVVIFTLHDTYLPLAFRFSNRRKNLKMQTRETEPTRALTNSALRRPRKEDNSKNRFLRIMS